MPRPYRQKRRAELQDQTRRRIVEAVVDLHGSVGPAATTISGIAERAGVQRVTVYKHFPDEQSLFHACSTHWQQHHPPPDPRSLASIAEPADRVRQFLTDLYGWYAGNEPMIGNTLRDLPRTPALTAAMAPMLAYMEDARMLLARGWPDGDANPRLKAAIGHALDFTTWRSLVRQQGLPPHDAVNLMTELVVGQAREGNATGS